MRVVLVVASWLLIASMLARSVSAQESLSLPPLVPTPSEHERVASLELQMRLRVLDESLKAIAKADRERLFYGWFQVAISGALGTSLIWVRNPEPRAVLGLAAAVSLGRGIAQLALSPKAAQSRERFLSVRGDDPTSLAEKLRLGEQGLARAATAARRTRLTDGVLTMTAAVTQVPLTWALSRREEPGYGFGDNVLDYVGLSLAIIAFASGLVNTLVQSDVEELQESYARLPRPH